MRSLQHEYALASAKPGAGGYFRPNGPPWPRGDTRLSEVVVLTGALTESEWDRVRAFILQDQSRNVVALAVWSGGRFCG